MRERINFGKATGIMLVAMFVMIGLAALPAMGATQARPSVSVGNPYSGILPGSTATYTVMVTNIGETSGVFELLCYGYPVGWTASFSDDTLTIDPGDNDTSVLTITAKVGATPGTSTITVEAQLVANRAITDSLTVSAMVGNTYGVDLRHGTFDAIYAPLTPIVGGSAVDFINIWDTGTVNEGISLSFLNVPTDWACTFTSNPAAVGTSTSTVYPDIINVNPVNLYIRVHASLYATPSDNVSTIAVFAEVVGHEAYNDTLHFNVIPVANTAYDVSFVTGSSVYTPARGALNAWAISNATPGIVQFQVRNTGLATEGILLTSSISLPDGVSSSGWTVKYLSTTAADYVLSPDGSSMTLNNISVGASPTVSVQISPAAAAVTGTAFNITLKATVRDDVTKSSNMVAGGEAEGVAAEAAPAYVFPVTYIVLAIVAVVIIVIIAGYAVSAPASSTHHKRRRY